MERLEVELAFVQFAQGVLSYEDTLRSVARFSGTRNTFMLVTALAGSLDPVESDAEQALRDSSLGSTFEPSVWMKHSKTTSIRVILSEDIDEENRKFLVYLFRATYQRYAASERKYPSQWWHSDLSDTDVVQNILMSHNNLVEKIYSNPSFRSEFATLAKLHYSHTLPKPSEGQQVASQPQSKLNFLTYDEVVTACINGVDSMTNRAEWVLTKALKKAFTKQYAIDAHQASRVIYEVIDRHMRESYNTGLY